MGRQIRLKRPGLAVFLRMVWEMKADDIASLSGPRARWSARSGGGICPGRSRPIGSKHLNNGSRRQLSNCCWVWIRLRSSRRWENSAKHQGMSNALNESQPAILNLRGNNWWMPRVCCPCCGTNLPARRCAGCGDNRRDEQFLSIKIGARVWFQPSLVIVSLRDNWGVKHRPFSKS